METEDAAARVAFLDVPCCEVFLETYSEYRPAFGRLVRSKVEPHTQVVSIHSKTQHFESDIFGQSHRQREDAFAMMDCFLGAGSEMGAGVYVYHGPVGAAGPERYTRWQEGLERAMALCAAHGIDLSWETVSWCSLNSPEQVRAYRKLWPSLHFVLDVKQVLRLGHDPVWYVDAMGDRLRHVHILDYDTQGALTLPGPGGAHDFRALAKALHASGYAGDIILEPYANVVPSDAALLDSIAWLRETFDAE